MITGNGGFVHRMMPPTNWDHGPIPESCYNPDLSIKEIENKLLSVYLEPERVKKLANSDDEVEISWTKVAIEMVAEIDAQTIYYHNLYGPKKENNAPNY